MNWGRRSRYHRYLSSGTNSFMIVLLFLCGRPWLNLSVPFRGLRRFFLFGGCVRFLFCFFYFTNNFTRKPQMRCSSYLAPYCRRFCWTTVQTTSGECRGPRFVDSFPPLRLVPHSRHVSNGLGFFVCVHKCFIFVSHKSVINLYKYM